MKEAISIGVLAWRVLGGAHRARKEREREKATGSRGEADPVAGGEGLPKEGAVIRLAPERGWRRAK